VAPDSEEFGSVDALFALNAALVAAEIAGFIADDNDHHIIDAIGYARDSLDAKATIETEATVYDRAVGERVAANQLVQRERQAEEEDVAFLPALVGDVGSPEIIARLRQRAESQPGLL